MGAPKFWYGFVTCAALIGLALLPRALLLPPKPLIFYRTPERATIPLTDPFYVPGIDKSAPYRAGNALREHRERPKEARPWYDKASAQSRHVKNARKQAI